MSSAASSSAATGKLPRLARVLAWSALLAGVVCVAAGLSAGLGYRLEWWSLRQGLALLQWAAIGAIAGAAMALVAALLPARVWRVRALAGVALLLNVLVAAPPLYQSMLAQRLPKIHDISTDTEDPPSFVSVLPLRQGARNPVDYPPATAAQQKQGYPDIAPLRLPVPPDQALASAERAARAMGWQIVDVSPASLRIEATDTTLFFGFKDDIVIRVRPAAQGSVVDVRSLSRIGGSDVGANARRVRAYLARLASD